MFKLSQDADINGTCLQGYVMAAPAALIEKFGQPQECDGYKVSGEYAFENDAGEVFTLYDWKCTTLYESDAGVTPSDFWKQTCQRQFNIGGRTNSFDFIAWLKKQILL